jgi:hypothetical protein
MPEKSVHEQTPPEPPDLTAIIAGSVSYRPTAEELGAVREYLRDIQAAVDLLPELDPMMAGLDPGFDPKWPTVTS